MLLCQQTHKTHLNYRLVAVELPFIPKVIDCMHQTITKTHLERQHSILLSATHTLCLPSLSRCRSLCEKVGVILRQAWSESQWTVLMSQQM